MVAVGEVPWGEVTVFTAAMAVAEEVLSGPVADCPNWTLPRLADEIETRAGVRISRSRLSVVLRKKGGLPLAAARWRPLELKATATAPSAVVGVGNALCCASHAASSGPT